MPTSTSFRNHAEGDWPYDGWPSREDVVALGLDPDAGEWLPIDWGGSEFIVNFDPMPQLQSMPEELKGRHAELHAKAFNPDDASVKELRKLIDRYPDVPFLKNFLRVSYVGLKRKAESEAVVESAVRAHPDYPFARLDYANLLIDRGDADAALESLGGKFDLVRLEGGRRVIHFSAFLAFLMTNAHYAFAKKKLVSVEACYDLLDSLDPEHPMLKTLEHYAFVLSMDEAMNPMLRRAEFKRSRRKPGAKAKTVKKVGTTARKKEE